MKSEALEGEMGLAEGAIAPTAPAWLRTWYITYLGKGVATKFVLEFGFIGTQTHLPPKFSFSSDFGHFIFKMSENAKFLYVSRKKILEYPNFCGGRLPRFSKLQGS